MFKTLRWLRFLTHYALFVSAKARGEAKTQTFEGLPGLGFFRGSGFRGLVDSLSSEDDRGGGESTQSFAHKASLKMLAIQGP